MKPLGSDEGMSTAESFSPFVLQRCSLLKITHFKVIHTSVIETEESLFEYCMVIVD
jgi:hypothetical protein